MTRLAMRLAAATAAPILLSLAPVGVPGGAGPGSCALAQGTGHAAVVVEHSDGRPGRRVCVAFAGSATGAGQILADSGLEYKTAYYPAVQGNAVCEVDYEPVSTAPWTSDNCLGSQYWGVYLSRGGGAWSSSPVGISDLSLSDGDALGLTFGSRPPIPPGPQGVCPAPQPTPPVVGPSVGPPSVGGGITRPVAPPLASGGNGPTTSAGTTTGEPGAAASPPTGGSSPPRPPTSRAGAIEKGLAGGRSTPEAIASALQGGLAGITAAMVAAVVMIGLLLYHLLRGTRGR